MFLWTAEVLENQEWWTQQQRSAEPVKSYLSALGLWAATSGLGPRGRILLTQPRSAAGFLPNTLCEKLQWEGSAGLVKTCSSGLKSQLYQNIVPLGNNCMLTRILYLEILQQIQACPEWLHQVTGPVPATVRSSSWYQKDWLHSYTVRLEGFRRKYWVN